MKNWAKSEWFKQVTQRVTASRPRAIVRDMIRTKDPVRKAKRRKAVPAIPVQAECPACKRPFPMTPAERQRRRRALLKQAAA